MKQIIPIIIIIGLVFLSGCQGNTQLKYQCANGEIVDSLDLCSTQICPELDCSKCPKQVETETKEVIKYQCQDGTVKDSLKECQDNPDNNITTDQVDKIIKVDEATYNISNVLVTIQLHNIEDKGIGEYIVIKNYRDSTIKIGPGCNYPISPYANGCKGWSIREYEDFPAFNYKYVNPNSKVSGWVWGLTEDFFSQYDTNKVILTIKIDDKEISFNKTLDNIDSEYKVDYKFTDFNDYQNYIKEELEDLVGMDNLGNYGGQEARYGGSIYFLMYKKGEWDFYNYLAVEVNAETGELIKYKDITASDGSRDKFDEIWWTPERQ